jgi:glutathione S-transferase
VLILHDFDLSAECYAARLLAALLGVPLDLRRLDVYPGREQEGEAFRAINPLATVPVLQDGDLMLRDWQAILAHLAFAHDPSGRWWPQADPGLIEWLGFARLLGASAGLARLHDGIGVAADIERCRADAHALLRELERHLWFGERDGRDWLLPAGHPTVADLAVFVHAILCEEGGISRMDYPAVRRWTDRIRHLDGFVAMSGIFPPRWDAAA